MPKSTIEFNKSIDMIKKIEYKLNGYLIELEKEFEPNIEETAMALTNILNDRLRYLIKEI